MSEVDYLNVSNKDIECQWIELCLDHQRNLIIANVYRPPQGDVDDFISYLENSLDNLNLVNKDVFILGDMNIDVSDKKAHDSKKLTAFILPNGLTNCIRNPTRYCSTKASCIDHIYTNSAMVSDSGVLDINISDHEMVYLVRKKVKTKVTSGEFSGRSYRNYDRDRFFT